MIAVFILVGSVLFYFSLYGYLCLNVNKLRGKMPLRILSWAGMTMLLLTVVIIGMAIIQNNFPEYNKALAILPIVIGFLASVLKNKDLWKQLQN